jgi:hypothetical protein
VWRERQGALMPKDPPFHDVSVYIEQDGTNKFKIQSDQLEQIGKQLRGRREFSPFQSIILPLIVSVATLIFSSAFQYVSWFNSVGVKEATDIAEQAARTYENSAAAIGARHYATLVFLPSLRDLVHAKRDLIHAKAKMNAVLGARAQGKGLKERGLFHAQASAPTRASDAERSLLSAVVQSTDDIKDNEISLHKFDLDIKQKRYASYYEQLKLWNENYDRLLSEIEYALDRPVFGQADKTNEDLRINRAKITPMNCANYLHTEELQRLKLNSHSLKLRFAAINNCFMEAHSQLDGQRMDAMSNSSPDFSKPIEDKIRDRSKALLAMANEFRCYAHRRIDYYSHQKELAIFSISYVWRSLTDATKAAALKHFEDTANSCGGPKHPA